MGICKRRTTYKREPCDHYIRPDNDSEPGFCNLPHYFKCIEAVAAKGMVLSQSGIQDYMDCNYKYFLKRICGFEIKPEYKSEPLKMGSAWDAFVNKQYGYTDEETTLESLGLNLVSMAKVKALMRAYKALGIEPDTEALVGVQQEFLIETPEANIRGILDREYTDHIVEVKLSSRPENYNNAWDTRFQNGTYLLARPETKFVLMEVTRTPSQRLGNDEDIDVYEERVFQDIISRPSHYFPPKFDRKVRTYGYKLYRNEYNTDAILNQYGIINKEIQYRQEHNTWYQECNCDKWGGCEFKTVCQTGRFDDQKFTIREKPDGAGYRTS